MSGFIRDPLSDIQLIADNLRDRYKSGFPVLKEIVQNADDARAESLLLGWHEGLEGAEHPLLRDPAIFFVNDAKLSDADAKGIRSIGLGSKAGNQHAVGKFGLGMKSLFHLGEVYFYVGSDWQGHQGPYAKADVLNPWGDERPDWEHFSENDKRLLQSTIGLMDSGLASKAYTFIVWIPLRSDSIAAERGEKYNYIINSPDFKRTAPSFIIDPYLPVQLGHLLPMLKTLKSITGYTVTSGTTKRLFAVQLQDGSGRCTFPDTGQDQNWQGKIFLQSGQEKELSPLSYVGVETMLESEPFARLKAHQFWPISYGRNSAGAEQKIEDKTKPHAAAVLIARRAGDEQATLTIRWAVFLPLGDQDVSQSKQAFVTHITGDTCFELFLHGYFFIDAGRVGIHGRQSIGGNVSLEPSSEENVTHEWNRLLANEGTLSLILASVSQVTARFSLTAEQTIALSEGLRRYFSNEGSRYQNHATAKYQWIFQMLPGERSHWSLIAGHQPTRPLPTPASNDYHRVWDTLPGLKTLAEDYALFELRKPNILALQNSCWQREEVSTLLKSVSPRVFESQIQLGYLNEFLESLQNNERCLNALIRLARCVMAEIRLPALSAHKSAVWRFLCFIPETYRWVFGIERDEQLLWDTLPLSETDRLIVPACVIPEGECRTSMLNVDDADKCLIAIAQSTIQDERKEKASLEFLSALIPFDKDEILKKRDTIKLFRAYRPGHSRPFLESRRTLQELFQQRRLFRRGEVGNYQLGEFLEGALEDRQVVFINKDVNDKLFNGKVTVCDTQAVLHLLEKRPRLAVAELRAELVSKLQIDNALSVEKQLAVRYLLHACKRDIDPSCKLWSVVEGNPVWSLLHKETLASDNNWHIIPYALSRTLKFSYQEKERINLKEMNARNVLEALGEDILAVDFSSLVQTQEYAEEILRYIEDDIIWRQLPLHKTVNGEFIAITDRCALHSDYPLPKMLAQSVIWMERALSREVQKQQDNVLPGIDADKAIALALGQQTPSQYNRFIIEQINQSGRLPELIELKTKPWLLANGHPVAPAYVIAGQPENRRACYLLGKESNQIFFAGQIDNTSTHDLALITPLLLNSADEIAAAALKIAANTPGYQIGQCRLTTEVLKQAANYAEVFSPLKGWKLIIECFNFSSEGVISPASAEILIGNLVDTDHLVEAHERLVSLGIPAEDIAQLRGALLTAICATSAARNLLPTLTLRTQANGYASATQLCYGVIGAAGKALLHEQDWQIIKSVLPESVQQASKMESLTGLADNTAFLGTAGILESYFSHWQSQVTNGLAIAANMLLMSGTPDVEEVCLQYLGQHTADELIDKIGQNWKVLTSSPDNPVLFPGKSLRQAVSSMQFSLTPFEGERATVHSILNYPIEIELESNARTLFIWERHRFASSTKIGLLLRKLPVMEMEEVHLLEILKQSAELLLEKVYGQRLSLDHIWGNFTGAEQLDILTAKITMLDSIVYQLEELRLSDAPLAELIAGYYQARDPEKGRFNEVERARALEKISAEIESRNDLQTAILQAVRHKITQAQYHPQSIPFELFQNADDAVIELAKLGVGADEINVRSVFKVRSGHGELQFFNWGREVNQFRAAGSAIDGTEFRFKTDLEKMIARNRSNKDEKTTGKFGLGFKSCLLVTDKPHIVSGRLAVQIEGGILPKVSDEHDALFRLVREERLEGGYKPTLVSLPLQEEFSPDIVLQSFNRHVALLPVFARQIHTIQLNGESYHWKPKSSELIEGLSFGTVRVSSSKRKSDMTIAALKTEAGSFVFRRGPKGPIPLGNNYSIPRLWNLAPLLGDIKLGFAINANFDVDIGRNQLAITSAHNRRLFTALGGKLAYFLSQLFQRSQQNWRAIKSEWELDDETDFATFWGNLWQVLQKSIPGVKSQAESNSGADSYADLILQMFSAETGGILSFYHLHKALPTGMSDASASLISMTTVTHQASELLSNISSHVSGLSALQRYFQEERLVSFAVGRSLIDLGLLVPVLELETLLDEELDDSYLSPSKAAQLQPIFDETFDNLLNKEKATQEQIERFKERLAKVTVLMENHSHRSVKEALLRQTQNPTGDENLVIDFAPQSFILSSQYSENDIRFIDRCRRATRPYHAETLDKWAKSPDVGSDPRKQKALCWYLVTGLYGEALADGFKAARAPHWLFTIDVQHLQKWGWQRKYIDIFRNVRMITDHERNKRIHEQLSKEGRSSLGLTEALERIYDWWEKEAPERTDYDSELYPDGQFDWLAIKEDDRPEHFNKAWLQLLFLGSCQTLGRTREYQHRDALKFFNQQKWWDVFVRTDNADDWFEVMDRYLAKSITGEAYRVWLQILPLYRFSSNLTDYIDLFWSAESGLPNINDLIRPGQSAILSGSNFAPPELKSTLGIGVNFILRELCRHNIYDDHSLAPHCYMASAGVRDLLSNRLPEGGLQLDSATAEHSKEIYAFLCRHMGEEKATFNGAFDIPLHVLARRENRECLVEILEIGS
ncbi:hypothetical protein HF675_11945 [Serratia sp. JUb9]|uniref:sacsin N-terminal ATP-binding-like domain-containing protein n=1 Tax=Serratia sp. JUb9 TaxID=2724469 RepID=UPI00164CF35A|nr:hypothetical protein [Serratia sp. JUb9]QNK34689.1 hypothetical protein HF675_11945 [Serratia sp. JUb9]